MARANMTCEGNVGKEPDVRFSKSGKAITKFNIAVTDRKQDAAGEWEDGDTMWVQVVTFGALAEDCAEGIDKGARVLVTGRPKLERWEAKDGGERTTLVILADAVGIKPRAQPRGGGGQAKRLQSVPDDVAPF